MFSHANLTLNQVIIYEMSLNPEYPLLEVAKLIMEQLVTDHHVTAVILRFLTHRVAAGGSIVTDKLIASASVIMPNDYLTGRFRDLKLKDLDTILQTRERRSTGGHTTTKYIPQDRIEIEVIPIYEGLDLLIRDGLYPISK